MLQQTQMLMSIKFNKSPMMDENDTSLECRSILSKLFGDKNHIRFTNNTGHDLHIVVQTTNPAIKSKKLHVGISAVHSVLGAGNKAVNASKSSRVQFASTEPVILHDIPLKAGCSSNLTISLPLRLKNANFGEHLTPKQMQASPFCQST